MGGTSSGYLLGAFMTGTKRAGFLAAGFWLFVLSGISY